MTLRLQREPATDDAVLGRLFIDGVFECFTLEGAGVEIPAGRYRLTITRSQRFQRMLPLVLNVPERSGIRIHGGNTTHDTEGCILVGQSAAHESVLQSQLALGALQPKLAGAIARGEDVWLTVRDPITSFREDA